METFKTSNNLTMVRGELYNWQVQPVYRDQDEPIVYTMGLKPKVFNELSDMVQACYDPSDEILSFAGTAYSDDTVYRFYCASLRDAEVIVHAFIKANGVNITGLIYDKNTEHEDHDSV